MNEQIIKFNFNEEQLDRLSAELKAIVASIAEDVKEIAAEQHREIAQHAQILKRIEAIEARLDAHVYQ